MDASPILSLRARGEIACFTRPEMKVERVSYPCMTPSAARGLLEAILWKPAIRWRIRRIHVLAPIRYLSFRRNEVNSKATNPASSLVANGGVHSPLYADDDRAQRNTVALRDVDYLIEAAFEMTPRAGPDDNILKFVEIFRRRVAKGQHFHAPYLGCREFAAQILTAEDAPSPKDLTSDLGLMLWDIQFRRAGNLPLFFHARLEGGILHVPEDPAASFQQGGAE